MNVGSDKKYVFIILGDSEQEVVAPLVERWTFKGEFLCSIPDSVVFILNYQVTYLQSTFVYLLQQYDAFVVKDNIVRKPADF